MARAYAGVDSQLAGRYVARRFQNTKSRIRNWALILDDLYEALSLVITLTGCDKIILGGSLTAKLQQEYVPVQGDVEIRFHTWQRSKHQQVSLVASGYGEAPLIGASLTARAVLH